MEQIKPISEIRIAWLAGLIDGEGSIGMYAVKRKLKYGYGIAHIPQLQISNDDTTIINEAQEVIVGIIGTRYMACTTDCRVDRRNSHLHYRVFVPCRSSVIKVLSAIEPYLIGKKSQAQILLQMLRTHKHGSRYTRAELEVIDILKGLKLVNKHPVSGNAVPMRETQISQKCVETLQAQLL